jgi:hypothetical protein
LRSPRTTTSLSTTTCRVCVSVNTMLAMIFLTATLGRLLRRCTIPRCC